MLQFNFRNGQACMAAEKRVDMPGATLIQDMTSVLSDRRIWAKAEEPLRITGTNTNLKFSPANSDSPGLPCNSRLMIGLPHSDRHSNGSGEIALADGCSPADIGLPGIGADQEFPLDFNKWPLTNHGYNPLGNGMANPGSQEPMSHGKLLALWTGVGIWAFAPDMLELPLIWSFRRLSYCQWSGRGHGLR